MDLSCLESSKLVFLSCEMKVFRKSVGIIAMLASVLLNKFTCAGYAENSQSPYVLDPSVNPDFNPFSAHFPPQYVQGPFEESYGDGFQGGPPSGPFSFYGQPSFGTHPQEFNSPPPYQHHQKAFPPQSQYSPQSQFQQSPPLQPQYSQSPGQNQYQRPPSQYNAPTQNPAHPSQQLLSSGSPPGSRYGGYFYQVNQGYDPNHNSLSQSPYAVHQDGSHAPITYGEQFQPERVEQYGQNLQSHQPAQAYGFQVQPSLAPSTYNAPAHQNYQESYQVAPGAPVVANNYQDTYGNNYGSFGGNAGNTGEFSLSAPSNTAVVIDKSPVEQRTEAPKKSEAEQDKEDKSLGETKIRKTKPGITRPTVATIKNLAGSTEAVKTKISNSSSYGVTIPIPIPTEVTKSPVFGQRISRGRARNPFRKPEFEAVTEKVGEVAASNDVAT